MFLKISNLFFIYDLGNGMHFFKLSCTFFAIKAEEKINYQNDNWKYYQCLENELKKVKITSLILYSDKGLNPEWQNYLKIRLPVRLSSNCTRRLLNISN